MPGSWTYIVDEPMRTDLLRSYGIEDEVIALGVDSGWSHQSFDFCCRKPSHSSDDQHEIKDDVVVAIYETDVDESYSCRKCDDGLEFVYFNVKTPEDIKVIGHSVQSLLAALFEDLVQSTHFGRYEMADAAKIVGFKHLKEVFEFVINDQLLENRGYYERRFAFLNSLSP